MICRIVALVFVLTNLQAAIAEKIKLDTTLLANLDQLLRRTNDYDLVENPFQIVPLEMILRGNQNPRLKTNRNCQKCKLDFKGKPEPYYEVTLPEQRLHKSTHPLKKEDRLEGILLPFAMPSGGGFFGRK